MLHRRSAHLGLLALAAAAGSASAQCTWYVPDVPDLDQQRNAVGSTPGLPGDGTMYCVPTSFTNWFAYLANHGIPQPNSLDGPRDWESNANYDRVTSVLSTMGALMNTDPAGGTKGGSIPGAKAYAALWMNGDVIVSGSSVWGSDAPAPPSPGTLQLLNQMGAYTAGTYGFYTSTTGGQRTGGHAITFTGVWDLGCGAAPILQFNDPNDDRPANTTQSEFRTCLAAMVPVSGTFTSSSGSNSRNMTLYRLDITTATTHFLDAVYAILPTSALFGGGGSDAGELQLVRPFRPQGNTSPAAVPYNKPAGTGPVLDVAVSPDPLVQYYITGQGASQAPGVWRLSVLTGVSTRINPTSTTGFDPQRLVISRFGELYLINGASVARYDPRTTPMTLLSAFTPSELPDAIAYDDKNDTIVILSEPPALGSRRLITFPRTLSGFGTDRPVPNAYAGEAYVQPDADAASAYFICSEGGGVLRRYEVQAGDLVVTDSIVHIGGSLTALNITDANRVLYANNGVLVEKEENAAGTWVNVTNSRWAGRAAPGAVSLARSRDNFTASLMNGPDFNNVANTPIYPGLPTCYANCDQSTLAPVLNVNDFTCFLNKYASGNVYANCDNSTVAPILNVNDFTCFLNRYASGCP